MSQPGFVDRGARFISSLASKFQKDTTLPPPISLNTAIALSVLYTIIYIAPFYLSPVLRATPLSNRDAPSVIQARVRAVVLICVVCSLITAYVLLDYGHTTWLEMLRLTGMWPVNVIDCSKVLILVAVLFVGPLYETMIVDGEWRDIRLKNFKATLWDSLIGWRNLVIAPASEELVFRALVVPLYLLAKVSATRIVFISPLIFGLAHLHHLVEFVNAHTLPGQTFPSIKVLLTGIVRSLFQFTYTTLFGFFAAFVFLRTGSLWAAIFAHSFCNWMGFPRVWGRLGSTDTDYQYTPDVAQGKKDEDGITRVGDAVLLPDTGADRVQSQQTNLIWTILYYALLIVGAVSFHRLLWPLTQSDNALISFAKT